MFLKLIFYFCLLICVFVLLLGCVFVLLVLFVLLEFLVLFVPFARAKSFRKKQNKEFITALITSFILLLNLSYYKHEFFDHDNLFQSLQFFSLFQSFSIITICFNHYTIFFNHYNPFQL